MHSHNFIQEIIHLILWHKMQIKSHIKVGTYTYNNTFLTTIATLYTVTFFGHLPHACLAKIKQFIIQEHFSSYSKNFHRKHKKLSDVELMHFKNVQVLYIFHIIIIHRMCRMMSLSLQKLVFRVNKQICI